MAPSNTLHDHHNLHILVPGSPPLRMATMFPFRIARVLFTRVISFVSYKHDDRKDLNDDDSLEIPEQSTRSSHLCWPKPQYEVLMVRRNNRVVL